jgi:MFS family permease
LLSYGVGPALSVYGPELFPTGVRSKASGVLGALGAAGGVLGLLAAAGLSDVIGTIGPALAILAAGPAIMVVLILVAYPETARHPLEQLNPEDGPLVKP